MSGPVKGDIEHARWIIDGFIFTKATSVMVVARDRGATFSMYVLAKRLAEGATTWEQILRPIQGGHRGAAVSNKKVTDQRKRDEMAELIANLDQRKRDMGLGD